MNTSIVIQHAWTSFERSKVALTKVRTLPDAGKSEIEHAEVAFINASERLAFSLTLPGLEAEIALKL